MLNTRVCELFGIRHPVVLGGMASGTTPQLVAAVSNAGGLGIHGVGGRSPAEVLSIAGRIREGTQKPFGLNLLLFMAQEDAIQAVLDARAPVFSPLDRRQRYQRSCGTFGRNVNTWLPLV